MFTISPITVKDLFKIVEVTEITLHACMPTCNLHAGLSHSRFAHSILDYINKHFKF